MAGHSSRNIAALKVLIHNPIRRRIRTRDLRRDSHDILWWAQA